MTLVEVLLSGSLAAALSFLLLSFYLTTFKQSQALREKSDVDFRVHQLLDKLQVDLYKTGFEGILYEATSSQLWIRQFGAPNPNGLSWALLVGYRLLGSEVGRYQQDLAAPNDVPFPSPISSLGGLWNTRITFSAPASRFEVSVQSQSLEVSLVSNSQQYFRRIDFHL